MPTLPDVSTGDANHVAHHDALHLWYNTFNGIGPVIYCTSSTRPSSGLYEGLLIYETDTNRWLNYDGSGWIYPLASTFATSAYLTASPSVPSDATGIRLDFGGDLYDHGAMHETGFNTSRLTAPVRGIYRVHLRIVYNLFAAAGSISAQVRKNAAGSPTGGSRQGFASVQTNAGSSTFYTLQISQDIELLATEYVEAFTDQNSGTSKTILANFDVSTFSLTYLRPSP